MKRCSHKLAVSRAAKPFIITLDADGACATIHQPMEYKYPPCNKSTSKLNCWKRKTGGFRRLLLNVLLLRNRLITANEPVCLANLVVVS